MILRTEEFDIGPGVNGYLFIDQDISLAAVAVNPDLPTSEKDACEMQAIGHVTKRPPKGGRKFMPTIQHVENMDPDAIATLRSVLPDFCPAWVEEVRDACRIANHPRVIAGYCDISVSVVVAVIEYLKARGEIPENVGHSDVL